MSIRDHDQKIPGERLGTYTPGATLRPNPAGSGGGSEDSPSRSWTERTSEEDTRPQEFSGADVTAYGQMVSGASDQIGGGFGGANVGGYGQQGLGSQWGQAGYGPITQGANYSAGGARFGPAGFAPYPEGSSHSGAHRSGAQRTGAQRTGAPSGQPSDRPSSTPLFGSARDFSESAHDDHGPHYRHWRDARLAAHDEDYNRWRDAQARRYDEEYRTWRNSHHAAFSQAFEGWRDRGGSPQLAGSSEPQPERQRVDPNAVHGANPTLANIAEGGSFKPHHRHETESDREVDADVQREQQGDRVR
jgi:hypothetical protein